MHPIMTSPTMKERNVVFLKDFLSWNMKQCNKIGRITILYFWPYSPKPFQWSPSYFPDPGTKYDTNDNVVCSVHNLSRLKIHLQPQPAYYLFQTQPIHERLHENLHQEYASWDTLVIGWIDFRHAHCIWKIFSKVYGSQNIHHKVFSSHLAKSMLIT